MFNVGSGEMLLIFLVALIILGPDRLPDAARKVGAVVGDLRRMSSGFKQEMKQAMDLDSLREEVEGLKKGVLTPNPGPTLPPLDAHQQTHEVTGDGGESASAGASATSGSTVPSGASPELKPVGTEPRGADAAYLKTADDTTSGTQTPGTSPATQRPGIPTAGIKDPDDGTATSGEQGAA